MQGLQKQIDIKRQRWGIILGTIAVMVSAVGAFLIIRSQRSSSLPDHLALYMTYEVVEVYPHDPQAFTQGLVYLDGFLYESTGLYGESSLRKVELGTGEVLQQVALDRAYFGEGLTNWGETLIQLTWREGTGLIYDLADFSLLGTFDVAGEGWGLTQDGNCLIMSNGTSTLAFINPESFQITKTITVTYSGEDITRINELEYIHGQIFANIWQTDDIIRIDPETGDVVGWIDLSGILPDEAGTDTANVLNGIAYDPADDRLFVTGKRWRYLYEIRLIPIEENH